MVVCALLAAMTCLYVFAQVRISTKASAMITGMRAAIVTSETSYQAAHFRVSATHGCDDASDSTDAKNCGKLTRRRHGQEFL